MIRMRAAMAVLASAARGLWSHRAAVSYGVLIAAVVALWTAGERRARHIEDQAAQIEALGASLKSSSAQIGLLIAKNKREAERHDFRSRTTADIRVAQDGPLAPAARLALERLRARQRERDTR